MRKALAHCHVSMTVSTCSEISKENTDFSQQKKDVFVKVALGCYLFPLHGLGGGEFSVLLLALKWAKAATSEST